MKAGTVISVPEVIATRVELQGAGAQAPAAEAEYRCEGQPVLAGLTLAAVPALREICESDLRLILPARVGPVAVWAASVVSMFCPTDFCLPLWLSTATETTLRQQSAERKEDYLD
jgi:hypothetical protein